MSHTPSPACRRERPNGDGTLLNGWAVLLTRLSAGRTGRYLEGGASAVHFSIPVGAQILEKKNYTFNLEQSKSESVKINFFLKKHAEN